MVIPTNTHLMRHLNPASYHVLSVTLYLLAISGVVSLSAFNVLPSNTLLELSFLLSTLFLIPGASIRVIGIIVVVVLFILFRYISSFYLNSVHWFDFLQAYQWIIFIAVLVLFVNRYFYEKRYIVRLVQFLVLAFFTKYLIARIFSDGFRVGERPGIFVENNYELPFLASILAVVYPSMGKKRWLFIGMFAFVVILSGSRSATVSFLILYLYITFGNTVKGNQLFGRYVKVVALALPVAAVAWVFQSRYSGGGLASIDRFRFAQVLFDETRSWNAFNWLFGMPPHTPLQTGSCLRLQFYEGLFSESGDGSCYSVILHAFLLRVVFDFGIVGLVGAFLALWMILRTGGVSKPLAGALVAIALSASASISGLNSIFLVLPSVFALLMSSQSASSAASSRIEPEQTVEEGGSSSVRNA